MLPVWLASFDAAEHERFGHLLRRSTPAGSVGLMVSWLLDVTPESLRPFALGRLPRAFRLAHQMCWRPSFDRRYGGSRPAARPARAAASAPMWTLSTAPGACRASGRRSDAEIAVGGSVDGGVRRVGALPSDGPAGGGALAQVGDERVDRRLVDGVDHAVQRRRWTLLVDQPAASAQRGGQGGDVQRGGSAAVNATSVVSGRGQQAQRGDRRDRVGQAQRGPPGDAASQR